MHVCGQGGGGREGGGREEGFSPEQMEGVLMVNIFFDV